MRKYPDDDLLDAENKLEDAQAKYLEKSGWKHSSNHPGSIWLWTKAFDGYGSYTVPTGTAIYMQRCMDK
jgi:hypothetical protein